MQSLPRLLLFVCPVLKFEGLARLAPLLGGDSALLILLGQQG